MIVSFKGATLLHVNGKTLKPGANSVDLAWWKETKKHPKIKLRIDGSDTVEPTLVEEIEVKDAEKTAGDPAADQNFLKGLKQPAALALVKETVDTDLLNKWLVVEHRKPVIGAINKMLSEIAAIEIRDRTEVRQISTGRGPDVVELKSNPNASDD